MEEPTDPLQIPHLHRLESRIRQAYWPSDGRGSPHLEGLLEQPRYSLAVAVHQLRALATAQLEAARILAGRHTSPNTTTTYQLEIGLSLPMFAAVDGFLDAARRAQNALWIYLSKVLRVSLPQSMPDLVRKLRTGTPLLPSALANMITSYWDTWGCALKNYRDLSQHHAVVSSDARVAVLADGRCAIHLVLPKNPEAKNPGQLDYSEPYLYALPYLAESFASLYELYFRLTYTLLLYTEQPESEIVSISLKGGLVIGHGAPLGHRLIAPEEVDGGLTALSQRLSEEVKAFDFDVAPDLLLRMPRPEGGVA